MQYMYYEVYYPADFGASDGGYFGSTPSLECALFAANCIKGYIVGVLPDLTHVNFG